MKNPKDGKIGFLFAVVFLLYFLICAKNWGYTTKLGKKMGVEEKGVREWQLALRLLLLGS